MTCAMPRTLDELLDMPLTAPGVVGAFVAFVGGTEERAEAAERRLGGVLDRLAIAIPASVETAHARQTAADRPPFLTVDEAADFVGINRKTLYAAIRRGEVAGAREISGVIRIRTETFLASFDGAPKPRPKPRRIKSK